MTNIEVLDKAFNELGKKYPVETALNNICEYLNTGNPRFITSRNGARDLIKDFTYADIFDILSKYALLSFIRNNKEVTLTEEDVTKNTNDIDGNIEFTLSSAIETLVLINAINPFFGYTSLAISKNLKQKVIQSLVLERYKFNIKDDLDKDIAKLITIKKNNKPTKYLTSLSRIETCVRVIKEEENYDFKK